MSADGNPSSVCECKYIMDLIHGVSIERIDVISSRGVDGATAAAPLYELLVTLVGGNSTADVRSVLHSYERFIDLKVKLEKYPEQTASVNIEFPRVLKRSTFGIPISSRRNEERCNLLHKVIYTTLIILSNKSYCVTKKLNKMKCSGLTG